MISHGVNSQNLDRYVGCVEPIERDNKNKHIFGFTYTVLNLNVQGDFASSSWNLVGAFHIICRTLRPPQVTAFRLQCNTRTPNPSYFSVIHHCYLRLASTSCSDARVPSRKLMAFAKLSWQGARSGRRREALAHAMRARYHPSQLMN